jgi:hypothetical protein
LQQQGIRELCKEYAHIFALKLPREASKLTPFNITVDSLAWRVPKNRMPPRKQSSLKQVEIAKQVADLLCKVLSKDLLPNTIHRLWLFLNLMANNDYVSTL